MNFKNASKVPMPILTLLIGIFYNKKSNNNNRKKNFLNLPRKLKFTKEGKFFVVVLILIGGAAINTGNNLLYLIISLQLAFIILSGILSENTIKKINIKRITPRYVFKNTKTLVKLKIKNEKKKLPSLSFTIFEEDEKLKAEPFYILSIKGKEEKQFTKNYTFLNRGKNLYITPSIKTKFPFALFEKTKTGPKEDTIIVLPEIKKIETLAHNHLNQGENINSLEKSILGTEFFALRDYSAYDDARKIHWKSAAKTNSLLVKEFAKEEDKKITLIVNTLNPENVKVFENFIDEAASLAWHFSKKGFLVGLNMDDIKIKEGKDKSLYKILEALSLVIAKEEKGMPTIEVKMK